jgi:hypothetical protein
LFSCGIRHSVSTMAEVPAEHLDASTGWEYALSGRQTRPPSLAARPFSCRGFR